MLDSSRSERSYRPSVLLAFANNNTDILYFQSMTFHDHKPARTRGQVNVLDSLGQRRIRIEKHNYQTLVSPRIVLAAVHMERQQATQLAYQLLDKLHPQQVRT